MIRNENKKAICVFFDVQKVFDSVKLHQTADALELNRIRSTALKLFLTEHK